MSELSRELQIVGHLTGGLPRSPWQLNAVHESDAELVRLSSTALTLAVTTDSVIEEIASGLYGDPYTAGWMVVAASASDLAAVGAEPLGMVISVSLPFGATTEIVEPLRAAISDASRACELPVLGGDTNVDGELRLTGTALGVLEEGRSLTRLGGAPGDLLFASGTLGMGSAYALATLRPDRVLGPGPTFRPLPRTWEGRLLRRFATSAMDTSDGALPTLDELGRLNGTGFDIRRPPAEYLHPVALRMARAEGLPDWTMLAGPHGEYELLFTIPAAARDGFLYAAWRELSWRPVELGTVQAEPGVSVIEDGCRLVIDTARLRDLWDAAGRDVDAYAAALLGCAAEGPARPNVPGSGERSWPGSDPVPSLIDTRSSASGGPGPSAGHLRREHRGCRP